MLDSHTDIRTFQETLRANASDSNLVTFYKHWPFWPINHELPKLAVPEVLPDWQDKEFNPGLPTERTWIALYMARPMSELTGKASQRIVDTTSHRGTSTHGVRIA